MKNLFLLALVFIHLHSFAQTYVPEAVASPVSGFDQLRHDNPYILRFRYNDTIQNRWDPVTRYIQQNNPLSKLNSISTWNENAWFDFTLVSDSIIRDSVQQIIAVFQKQVYNYTTPAQQYKVQYQLKYNSTGQVIQCTYLETYNVNSNVYRKLEDYYISYDATSKRIQDSVITFYSGTSISLVHYYYDGTNPILLAEVSLSGDTIAKRTYTFNQNKPATILHQQFNSNTDEYMTTHSDSFEYNPNGNIISRKTAGFVSRNGVISFEPFRFDSYEYNSFNQLTVIVERLNDNGTWLNNLRTEVDYEQDKAQIAYVYPYTNDEWDEIPLYKLLFDFNTLTEKIQPTTQEPIVVYPNPANENITVESTYDHVIISLYDIQGKCWVQSTSKNLDTSTLPDGLYTMTINGGNNLISKRIIIQH